MNHNGQAKDPYSWWLPVAFLIGFYALFLYVNAVNIPQADDYSNLLKFLVDYLDAGSWEEKRRLLFLPNNTEHLTLLNRLLVLAQYHLAGELNFRHLIFVGNSFALLTFLLFVSQLPPASRHGFNVALGALLLFQPLGWHNGTWAMAALSNLGVWPLGLAALILANHAFLSWRRVLGAFMLGFAACLTQGNGFVVFLLLPLAIACRVRDARAYLVAALWLLAALLVYEWILSNDDELVQARMLHSLRFVLVAPLKAGLFHLVLVGRFFSEQVLLAAVMGVAGMAYTALCLVDLARGRAGTTQLFIVYIMGSLLLVTLMRAGLTFGDLNVSHRYWFYSQLFWFSVILDSVSRFTWLEGHSREGWLRWVLMALLFVLCLSRYVSAQEGISRQNLDKIKGQEAWLVSGHPLSNRHLALAEPAAAELQRALVRGVYDPYTHHPQYVDVEEVAACKPEGASRVAGSMEVTARPGAQMHRLTGWSQLPLSAGIPAELLLCSRGRAFRLPWQWTEGYFGPDQPDWSAGSVYNVYYLFKPLPKLEQVVLKVRSGATFLVEIGESARGSLAIE